MCLFSSYIQRPPQTYKKPPRGSFKIWEWCSISRRYPQVSAGVCRSRQAFLRNNKKSQKISKNLKFSKIKNIQNHYNRPKFKPTYYETKCSPEKMDKKINTQKLSTYYVWLDINVIFRHFLKTNYENFGLLKLQMVITQSIFIRFTRKKNVLKPLKQRIIWWCKLDVKHKIKYYKKQN